MVCLARVSPAAIVIFPAPPLSLIPTEILTDPADIKPFPVLRVMGPELPYTDSPVLIVTFPLLPSFMESALAIFTIPVDDEPIPDKILTTPEPCTPEPALTVTSPPVANLEDPPKISTEPPIPYLERVDPASM